MTEAWPPEQEYRRRRNIRGPVTLLVLLGVLAGAAWYGGHVLLNTAPPPEPVVTCSTGKATKGTTVKSSQITVNVYNAGTKSGLARRVAAELRSRGFHVDEIANSSSDATNFQVRARAKTPAAKLVAAQAKGSRVVKDEDQGSTIDIILGDDFTKLRAKAPTKLEVKGKVVTCATTTPKA